MPDLGKYAGAIHAAWGIALVLVAGLVLLSWRQSVVAKRNLAAAEARRVGTDDQEGQRE